MNSTSSAQLLVKNTLWVYASKIFTQILGIIALILVIRKIDVEMFGRFNLYISLFFVFGIFSMSPTINVFRRFVPEIKERGRFRELSKVVLFGCLSAFLLMGLTAWLIWVLHEPLGRLFKIDDLSEMMPLFLSYVVLHGIQSLFQTLLGSLLLHKVTSILNMVGSLIRTVCYLIFMEELSVRLLLYIEAGLALLFAVPAMICLSIWFYRFKMHTHKKMQEASIEPARMVKYGALSLFNEIGSGVVGRTSDYYIVAAIGSSTSVGFYAFASRLFSYFQKLLPVKEFLSVIRPVFISKFTKKHSNDEFMQVYNFIMKTMLPIYVFPGLFFFALGRPVIEFVFDPKYLSAYWVSVVILFITVPMAFAMPLSLTVELYERMEIKLYSKVVAVLSIIGGIMAMKTVGLVGVALVTLACDWLKILLIWLMLKRHVSIHYEIGSLRGYILSWTILAAGFYYLQLYVGSLLSLLLLSGLFCILFSFAIVWWHPFNDEDKELLNKLGSKGKLGPVVRRVVVYLHGKKPRLLLT